MIKKAKWIRTNTDMGTVCPIFSKDIHTKKGLICATAYVTAMGVYDLLINDEKIGNAVMTPGWTSCTHRVQYQTYDITKQMTKENNTVKIHCAPGWASGLVYYHKDGEFMTQRRLADHIGVLALIVLEYNDGSLEQVSTDETWDVYTSSVIKSQMYNGETIDLTANEEYVGNASFDNAFDDVEVFEQVGEYIREQERVAAKEYIVTPKGERVIDFGQNLAGYVEIRIKGKKGDRVVITHAEVLDKDGNFYTKNYRDAESRNEYILSGEEDVLKPRFTFRGYRYIRIDEYPFDTVDQDSFTSVAIYSDMKRRGNFVCGDEKINQLYSNIIWGQRSNFVDVPTDCPSRSGRQGWSGDAHVFCRTAAINYDASRFFKKWLGDMRVEQRETGAIPDVIPDHFRFDGMSSAGWGDAAVICPWELYLATGDISFLRDNLDMMKKWIECVREYGDEEYGWVNHKRCYGDWLAMDAGDDIYKGATQADLIGGAFFAYSTSLMIKTCKALGEDTEYYQELYGKVRTHFRACFMRDGMPVLYNKYDALSSDRPVKAVTQTSITLILKFGLCDEHERPMLAKKLVELIRENGNKITTGFLGTPYILHVLSENGYSDVAYELLFQEENPSWLFSVNHGATTMWEHWDSIKEDGTFWSDDMNSFNHYVYGSVYDWIFGVCAGITVNEEGAGYKCVNIRPTPCRKMGFADTTIETSGGTLRSAWRYNGDDIRFDIAVPNGTVAYLKLPDGSEKTLLTGRYLFVLDSRKMFVDWEKDE